MRRFADRFTLLEQAAGRKELPQKTMGNPLPILAKQQHCDVVRPLTDFLYLCAERQRKFVLTSLSVKYCLPKE